MSLSDLPDNAVVITGIGLLSGAGEGPDAHRTALTSAKGAPVDSETFAPYPVRPLGEVDWTTQISKRDMRQMEPWQRIGTYAAGLALDDANAKDEDLCGSMDMIVAAGGGERDHDVDATVLSETRGKNDVDNAIAERLSNDLRPTLFLAQLSNLLAGNISIVHKVTGSSRTFMGEEGAGISAIQTAHARIASGQSEIVLVGGAFNAERRDMMLVFELGQYLAQGVAGKTADGNGMVLASVGAFLVLESAAHARERGAKAYAELKGVVADHGPRTPGQAATRMKEALPCLAVPADALVLSGASGVEAITKEEESFLAETLPEAEVVHFGDLFGTSVEAQFPLGIALAALSINGKSSALVTTLGHWRAEGAGLVTKIEGA